MSEQLFYIQDTRQVVGNCAMWWRKRGQGYGCELDEAELFTQAEADRIVRESGHFVAWPREVVEANVTKHVRVEPLRRARAGR